MSRVRALLAHLRLGLENLREAFLRLEEENQAVAVMALVAALLLLTIGVTRYLMN